MRRLVRKMLGSLFGVNATRASCSNCLFLHPHHWPDRFPWREAPSGWCRHPMVGFNPWAPWERPPVGIDCDHRPLAMLKQEFLVLWGKRHPADTPPSLADCSGQPRMYFSSCWFAANHGPDIGSTIKGWGYFAKQGRLWHLWHLGKKASFKME